ncbi:hypothetical protein LZL87_001141 [Fusarium oxysporum]|nr:hypothetical protein LZL87_001141 [Fusarium oxysporum]
MDLAIVSAYPAYEPTSIEADMIDKARERLDRGSQDPEVRENSFFSVTTVLPTMAEDAESYAKDIQVLEHLDEDDKVTVLSATMPLGKEPSGRKSRNATSAWDQPNQTVVAAYNHEDMLDSNDEPHQVPVHGTYFNNVWIPGHRGSKVTNKDMRIVRKYVRASRLFIPGDGAKHMPERLPVETLDPESATPAVYVGISGVVIQHVFMRDKAKVNKVSFADNTESFDLRVEPSNLVAGINTIFHEGCTVPGNISRLKRFLKDKATVFEEQPTPMERLMRQNNRVLQYLPIKPVQNRKASDDAGHQPSYRILNRRELGTILIGFILPRTWDV